MFPTTTQPAPPTERKPQSANVATKRTRLPTPVQNFRTPNPNGLLTRRKPAPKKAPVIKIARFAKPNFQEKKSNLSVMITLVLLPHRPARKKDSQRSPAHAAKALMSEKPFRQPVTPRLLTRLFRQPALQPVSPKESIAPFAEKFFSLRKLFRQSDIRTKFTTKKLSRPAPMKERLNIGHARIAQRISVMKAA